jgi:hypothetical protein
VEEKKITMMVRVTASENTKSESNMKISFSMRVRVVSNNSTASERGEEMEIAVKHAITEGENPVSIAVFSIMADGV